MSSDLIKALESVNSFADGKGTEGVVYDVKRPALAVKALREGLRMSQQQFAEAFRFAVKTIQNWEQGVREPEGPARAYLTVIKYNPAAVQEALAAEWDEYAIAAQDKNQEAATANG